MTIAAANCEAHLAGIILMNLVSLIEYSGITEEEFAEVLRHVQLELDENTYEMEQAYQSNVGKRPSDLPWRDFARRKILSAFGSESCGETVRRLDYVEHVTAEPDLKQMVRNLKEQGADMNIFHPEKYEAFLADA